MIVQPCKVTFTDGTCRDVAIDQRGMLAAARAGHPMPTPVEGETPDLVGFMEYLRAAAGHMLRLSGWTGDLDVDVMDVSASGDVGEADPTPATASDG